MVTLCLRPRRSGYTLLELLTTISIIGILLALLLSVITKVQEAANAVTCQHKLRQLALAVHTYHDAKKHFPPYMSGGAGTVHGGWMVHLLPYVGEDGLYRTIAEHDEANPDVIVPSISAPSIRNRRFEFLRCASDPSPPMPYGTTNYLANWYAFTRGDIGAYSKPRALLELLDGPSNVVLLGEAYTKCQTTIRHVFHPPRYHSFGITPEGKPSDDPSYAPTEYASFQLRPDGCDAWRIQSPHSAMPVAIADGSVRIISLDIYSEVWLQVLKPSDGDPYEGEW